MAISNDETDAPKIVTAVVTEAELVVYLKDGRHVAMPLWWSPRLLKATAEQRRKWEISPFGDGLEWDEIDEHINVGGILEGRPAKGAVPPTRVSQVEHA